MTRDELKAQREELLEDIERRELENPFMQRRAPTSLVFKVRETLRNHDDNVVSRPSSTEAVADETTLILEAVAEFVTEKLQDERAAHQEEIIYLRKCIARLEGVVGGLEKERVFDLPALPMRGRQ